jgi:hypothetical protein
VSIGPVWIGRASFGSRDATETTGNGGTFRLFTTSSELAPASGVEGRVAVRLTRAFEVEARASYSQPEFQITAASDAESSNAPKTATDVIRQFTVGGGVLWYLRLPRLGARARLFVSAGAAAMRQLENGGTVVETGSAYDVGGGLKYALKSRDTGRLKGIGVRMDAGAKARARGVTLDDRAHVSPFLAASIYLRF